MTSGKQHNQNLRNSLPEDPTQRLRGKHGDALGIVCSVFLHTVLIVAMLMLTVPNLGDKSLLILTSSITPQDVLDNPEEISSLVEITNNDAIIDLTKLEQEEILQTMVEPFQATDALSEKDYILVPNAEALASIIPSKETGSLRSGTDSRSGAAKVSQLSTHGGTAGSERAVALGLRWLAEHQNRDGTWSLQYDFGRSGDLSVNQGELGGPDASPQETLISGTALALLPFLGAGETHQNGHYRQNVKAGLSALIALGEEDEYEGISWRDASGKIYSHGLAAIALTESYGITKDRKLLMPAQAAIDHLVDIQDPTFGGWRYEPRQLSDTSVTGWQVMALKSATLGGLKVPRRSQKLARQFFDSVQHEDGFRSVYLPVPSEDGPSKTLTAISCLSRMYLGWEQFDNRLKNSIAYVTQDGPSERSFYQNYYASQMLFHYTNGTGKVWERWNKKLRNQLINQQETSGRAAGSWWEDDPHNRLGGRLYTTSLAIMTLEVYYRYMPLYQKLAITEEFPE